LPVLLSMVAACTDAVSYLGLGHVFPANMTGNTVLLGAGAADGDLAGALRSAAALGAFLFGACAVAAAVRRRPAPAGVAGVLAIEAVLLLVAAGVWLAAGAARPVGATRYDAIALTGATMGAQSGLARRLDLPVSTTYITGTWTSLSVAVAERLHGRQTRGREDRTVAAVVVVTYLATAAGAAAAWVAAGAGAAFVAPGLLLPAIALVHAHPDRVPK
jgi:uncharacterized membrane protein YoaK (UPF0700 family)